MKLPTKSSKSLCSIIGTILFYGLVIWIQSSASLSISNRWGKNMKYYSEIKSGNLKGFLLIKEENRIDIKRDSNTYIIDTYLKDSDIKELEKERIKQQIYQVRDKAITSLRISRDFYLYMLNFSSILIISTIIAGIFGYPIISKGWDSTENYQKNIFLISLAISIFCASFNSFCKTQKNAETYMILHETYINLEEYIFSSLTIGRLAEESESSKQNYPNNLIQKVDKALEIYSLKIEFNQQSIPTLTDTINSINLNNNSNDK